MDRTPRELEIERLELRVALGGRSAGRSQIKLNELLAEDQTPRCPYCNTPYFECETDNRGICIKKPKSK